jgi:hypothetical protein
VVATAGASTLVWISGVNRGTTTKSYLNVSTHLANRFSANAVADMGIQPANVVFPMRRRASTCAGITKKRKKARRA